MAKNINNEIKKIKDALNEYKNNQGNKTDPNSLLVIAISNSDVNGVNNAIAQGADVGHVDKYGYTPLIYAAVFNESGEITSILLSKGADPFYETPTEITALDFAQEAKHYDVVTVLKKAMGIPKDEAKRANDSVLKHETSKA